MKYGDSPCGGAAGFIVTWSSNTVSLLSEWSVLQEHVVPLMADFPSPDLWCEEVEDAVALTIAAEHGLDGAKTVTTYSPPSPRPGTVSFSRSELRHLPAPVRNAAFRQTDRGWLPTEQIATRVFLSSHPPASDLVALSSGEPDEPARSAIARLRVGGYVLLPEDPDSVPGPGIEFQPVDGSGRLLRKVRSGRKPAEPVTGSEDPAESGVSLARLQDNFDLAYRYLNLARSLARRFAGHGEPRQDLDQVAFLGLLLAAQRFEANRDVSFSTFATTTILGELKRYFRDRTWMLKVPRRLQETYLSVKTAREALAHELGSSPTIAQISSYIGISEEAVLEAMEAGQNYWPESLDVSLSEDQSGREVPVDEPGFELAIEREQLTTVLHRLSHRQQLILKRLYFDGRSQKDVAEEIGISQMQVSRLLARTLRNCRENPERRPLEALS